MRRIGRLRNFTLLAVILVVGCNREIGGTRHDAPPMFTPPPTPAAGKAGRWTSRPSWLNGRALRKACRRWEQSLSTKGKSPSAPWQACVPWTTTVPVTVDDQWHVGAITQSMTATLAAILVEDGLITWDTTVLDVWPELTAQVDPGFRTVTLRQLLSHTSGMKPDDDWPGSLDGATGTLMEKRRAWAARLLSQPPAVPLGNFSSSNMGYVVAGAMLETRTQTPWETLLTIRVFAPLGMTHSGFGAPGTPGLLDEPLGHRDLNPRFEAVQPGPDSDSPQAAGPAGTVHVTLNDFGVFLLAHLAGEQGKPGLLTTASFRTLHTPVAGKLRAGLGGLAGSLHDRKRGLVAQRNQPAVVRDHLVFARRGFGPVGGHQRGRRSRAAGNDHPGPQAARTDRSSQ